jgi:hypothetical protein
MNSSINQLVDSEAYHTGRTTQGESRDALQLGVAAKAVRFPAVRLANINGLAAGAGSGLECS